VHRLLAIIALAVSVTACGSMVPSDLPTATAPVPATEPPAPSAPSSLTSTEPPASPEPVPTGTPPLILGERGSLVMADIRPAAAGGWVAMLTVVDAEGSVTATHAHRFTLPADWFVDNDEPPRVSNDGWLAVPTYESSEDGEVKAVAVVNPTDDEGAPARMVDGRFGTWAPGNVLVVLEQDVAGTNILSMTPDHGTGATVPIPDPEALAVARFGRPVAAADGTGLFAERWTDDVVEPLLLAWDGRLSPRDGTVPPAFATGLEWPRAADGSMVGDWCDDGPTGGVCGTSWTTNDRREVAVATEEPLGSRAWSRDGTSLIAIDGRDVVRIRVEDGRAVRDVLDRLPRIGDDSWEIAALSDDAAYLAGNGQIAAVRLDGEGIEVRSRDGWPAGVLGWPVR
jgi:hypothetical protein